MPRILKNIDQIALEKQRDVLYILFHNDYVKEFDDYFNFNYERCIEREQIILWLGQKNINFYECFGFSSNSGVISMPYLGELYLDVPFDEKNPQYQLLYNHLENADGSMKIQGIKWCYYPLKKAIEIHTNEPIDLDI